MPNGNSLSREAAQMPAPATSKQGLGREARAALLIVRTGPECPKDNLRELTQDSKPDCGITTTRKALTKNTQKNCTKKIFTTKIITMV